MFESIMKLVRKITKKEEITVIEENADEHSEKDKSPTNKQTEGKKSKKNKTIKNKE